MNVQILIATMGREEFSFLEKMNLFGKEIVVINQCDKMGVEKVENEEFSAKIIDTTQRGLSNSRNQAIVYASQDILLTADDDISYYPDAQDKIVQAFSEHPEADIIAFNIERYNNQNRNSAKAIKSWRKAPRHKYYPTVSLAYKRSAFQKANLSFHPLFGAGSKYKSGEESLLLRDARKKGLMVFECPEYIAKVDFSTSTWFTGYDERFFFDKGAWVKAAYPIIYRVIKYYFLKKRKKASISLKKIIASLNAGIKAYDSGKGYDE